MNTTRKITDHITYVTIVRDGASRTYHKTPATNTRLSTAWDWALKNFKGNRISYASYVRLHTLMMQQHVSVSSKTMVCYYPRKQAVVTPVILLDDQADNVNWWAA